MVAEVKFHSKRHWAYTVLQVHIRNLSRTADLYTALQILQVSHHRISPWNDFAPESELPS
jgi:hypothetical protein